jgi:hypothetical protein
MYNVSQIKEAPKESLYLENQPSNLDDLNAQMSEISSNFSTRANLTCKTQCAAETHLTKKYGEKKLDFSCQIAVLQYFLDFSSVSDVF